VAASPDTVACASWCAKQGGDLARLQHCHGTCLRHPALSRQLELLEASRREAAHRGSDGSAHIFASFFALGSRGAEVRPMAALSLYSTEPSRLAALPYAHSGCIVQCF
jgi:hypothetical protein